MGGKEDKTWMELENERISPFPWSKKERAGLCGVCMFPSLCLDGFLLDSLLSPTLKTFWPLDHGTRSAAGSPGTVLPETIKFTSPEPQPEETPSTSVRQRPPLRNTNFKKTNCIFNQSSTRREIVLELHRFAKIMRDLQVEEVPSVIRRQVQKPLNRLRN